MAANTSDLTTKARSHEERESALELMATAQTAEQAGEYKEAFNLHTRAGNILTKLVASGTKKSDVRRKDKLYLRAVKERRDVLKPAAEGSGSPPNLPLPSSGTWQKERDERNGKILLTLVETGEWGSLVGQVDSLEGLVFDENNNPYFTPMLPAPNALPDLTFEVYAERFTRDHYCYLHVKDATKAQTLYTLYTSRGGTEHISWASLMRASEYNRVCARIQYIYLIVPKSGDPTIDGYMGRSMSIETAMGNRVAVEPDRAGKDWSPRHFTYGGRTFVWKDESTLTNLEWERLYEQKGQPTAVEGSKTGKLAHRTFDRPIAWMKGKSGMSKVCTIGMVAGLDQIFQELILATAVGKVMAIQFSNI